MPNPEDQDDNFDTRPGRNASPSNPDRKNPTKPVGRDSDATQGHGERPTRTPTRIEPQDRPDPGQRRPSAPATGSLQGNRDGGTPSGGEVDRGDDLDAPGAPLTGADTLPRPGQSPGKPDSTEPSRSKEPR